MYIYIYIYIYICIYTSENQCIYMHGCVQTRNRWNRLACLFQMGLNTNFDCDSEAHLYAFSNDRGTEICEHNVAPVPVMVYTANFVGD